MDKEVEDVHAEFVGVSTKQLVRVILKDLGAIPWGSCWVFYVDGKLMVFVKGDETLSFSHRTLNLRS